MIHFVRTPQHAETASAFQWAGQLSEIAHSRGGISTPIQHSVPWAHASQLSQTTSRIGSAVFCKAQSSPVCPADKTHRPRYVWHL